MAMGGKSGPSGSSPPLAQASAPGDTPFRSTNEVYTPSQNRTTGVGEAGSTVQIDRGGDTSRTVSPNPLLTEPANATHEDASNLGHVISDPNATSTSATDEEKKRAQQDALANQNYLSGLSDSGGSGGDGY